MFTRKNLIRLLVLSSLLNVGATCQKNLIPNTVTCSVSGVLMAGADCTETLSDRTKSLSLNEFIDFLEPQLEVRDYSGRVLKPERAGAMCQSASDYMKQKLAIETLCARIKCTAEVKQIIQEVSGRIDNLQEQSIIKLKTNSGVDHEEKAGGVCGAHQECTRGDIL